MRKLLLTLLLAIAAYMSIDAQYLAKWTSMVNCTDSMTIISKSDSSYDWCAHAVSKNTLFPGDNGWIEYKVSQTGKSKEFGVAGVYFSMYGGLLDCDSTIDYGFYLDSLGNLFITEFGVVDSFGTYSINDLLRIEMKDDSIYFIQNNIQINVRSFLGSSVSMFCVVAFNSLNSNFENIRVSFDTPMRDTVNIVDDAFLRSGIYSNTNYGSYTLNKAAYISGLKIPEIDRSLIYFPIDTMGSNSRLISARLIMYSTGYSGYYSSKLHRVTSSWDESTVTYSSQPTYSSSDYVDISSYPATYPVFQLNITDIVDSWYNGTYTNYGLLLKKSSETVAGALSFVSSDGSPETSKPIVELIYIPSYDYCVPEKQPGSRSYDCRFNRLCFVYDEKYNVADANVLEYRIYDNEMTLVGGIDRETGILASGSPVEIVNEGMNKYELDLSGLSLTAGEYYLFEISTAKQEKLYIRFKMI